MRRRSLRDSSIVILATILLTAILQDIFIDQQVPTRSLPPLQPSVTFMESSGPPHGYQRSPASSVGISLRNPDGVQREWR